MEAKDINRLWASGNYDQINELLLNIVHYLKDKVCVSSLNSKENITLLELSFLSLGGFPKDIFRQLTKEISGNENLYIRVLSDELNCDHNKEYIFEHGKWSFDKHNIDLTKKAPLSTLTRYSDDKYAYTSGAYIQRVSYITVAGKRVFGWIVTAFEDDTYRNGLYLEVEGDADTLEGLTPAEELRDTELIVKSLQSHGAQSSDLGMYKIILPDEKVSIYAANLRNQSGLGNVEKIKSTLDNFLLNSPQFSQTTREILVDAFGADREDIFTSDGHALIIGHQLNNVWVITECK